ncbi:MAG: FAD-dependent oxidoreductase [Oligoflexales bacterium]|nr:FAD-dependent oxidoreductase [Oligoflexales bacterium]
MLVKKYLSEVRRVVSPLPNIHRVTFASDKKFLFRPGQFLHLALDEYNPSMAWPDSRCFSMESSPEDQGEVTITYSVVGGFTKRMERELEPGRKVWLKMPYGELFSGSYSRRNCVFLAGGTGVTPFLSLFRTGEFSDYENPLLFLGVRQMGFNIYGDALESACRINPSFKIHVIDELEKGRLDVDRIISRCGRESVYFISGPPSMIGTFRERLSNKGVPQGNIITDDWG